MSPVLDTAFTPPQDREEVVRNAVRDSIVAVDIDHGPPTDGISVRLGLGTVGPLRICSARATSVTIHRTTRLAREDTEPAVFLGVQMTGTSLVVQNDRECVLRPGECAVYESVAPYTLLFDEGVDHHFLRFPRAALALPERLLRDVTAVALGPGNPVARLAFTYFSQLAVSDEIHQGGGDADSVVTPSIELLRAVLATQHGNSGLAKGPLEATLTQRVTLYVQAHLADPDLSAARIAAVHGVSVRHLYAVLARSGITLGDWIRTRRLAECKRDLAGPHGPLRTIAATGRRWGFVDASHFSKVFRQTYGMSPRDWRDLNHPRTSM
ncbi:helix-turn-helix domain-containing protein [Actinacidiphila glaucinigra]|uniref:AraC-like ligand-binding domain-containing protein n=1 Tax=Actinacidiphila glaucinigra TaxID=235986 RepID=UPI0033A44985